MIISASRRTDIPTYYSDWFFNRIKDGFVYVRNPMNIHQVSQVSLLPDIVDGIVFWTKNPIPMMERLDELNGYTYYFQFTLNSYDKDVEPNIPSKNEIIIPAFQKLSRMIGKEKVVWRYDPIFLSEKYTVQYHLKYFRRLTEMLAVYTEKCTVSFLDLYKNTQRNINSIGAVVPSLIQQKELLQQFSEIAQENGIYIDTCSEDAELSRYGIKRAHCIDKQRFERLGNYTLEVEKDKNQRLECGCVESIDIGLYNTCKNGCLYCYANFSQKSVLSNFEQHNPESPLLSGEMGYDDILKVREVYSKRNDQMTLF